MNFSSSPVNSTEYLKNEYMNFSSSPIKMFSILYMQVDENQKDFIEVIVSILEEIMFFFF